MSSEGKNSCVFATVFSIGILVALGIWNAYPIAWGWGMHKIQSGEVRRFEFRGQVLDPDGHPIPEVKVSAELSTYSLFGGNGKEEFDLVTDQNGGFSLGPRKGVSLEIHPIVKEGFNVRGRKWPKVGWEYWVFTFSSPSYGEVGVSNETPFVIVMDPTTGP